MPEHREPSVKVLFHSSEVMTRGERGRRGTGRVSERIRCQAGHNDPPYLLPRRLTGHDFRRME